MVFSFCPTYPQSLPAKTFRYSGICRHGIIFDGGGESFFVRGKFTVDLGVDQMLRCLIRQASRLVKEES
jgi:hypothetical protein